MSCAACAARVDKVLNGQEGVRKAEVNFAAASVRVLYDPDICSPESLKKAVRDAGYDLMIEDSSTADAIEKEKDRGYRKLRDDTVLAIIFSLPVLVASLFFMEYGWVKYMVWILSTAVVFFFGRRRAASYWSVSTS